MAHPIWAHHTQTPRALQGAAATIGVDYPGWRLVNSSFSLSVKSPGRAWLSLILERELSQNKCYFDVLSLIVYRASLIHTQFNCK